MKKQLTFLVLLALLGAFMFSLEGCGDECEGSKRTSAEFRVYNELSYYDRENGKVVEKIKQVEEDTMMVGSYLTFEAVDANAISYEWTIGSDTRKRTEKKVTLLFDDESLVDESPITIKLKLTQNPNTKCFSDDKGFDSVMHKIYFLKREKWPVYGKYLGSDNTAPNEKYTIEIFPGFSNGFYTTDSLKNLPNNCVNRAATFRSGTAFEFAISGFFPSNGQSFPTPNCVFREFDKKIGYLQPNRKDIVIEYEFTDKFQKDESLQKRVFRGSRQ